MGWQVCTLPLGATNRRVRPVRGNPLNRRVAISYTRVAISPDGKRVVTGGAWGASEDSGDVQIWDVETAAQVSSWVEV